MRTMQLLNNTTMCENCVQSSRNEIKSPFLISKETQSIEISIGNNQI